MFEGLTIYQALKRAAIETPKETAIYFLGTKITYKHFIDYIEDAAYFLKNTLNVNKGDVVLLSLPNIPDSLILLYAINKIGATANMVHPYTPYNQVVELFTKTHSKVAFLFDQSIIKEASKYRHFPYPFYICRVYDFFLPFKKDIYKFFFNIKNKKVLSNKKKDKNEINFIYFRDVIYKRLEEIKTEVDDDSIPAVILHSGSTTGDPKVICLSNKNLNFTAKHACEMLDLTPEDIKGKAMLSVLPNFHGFGLCMTMHSPLVNSFGTVLVPKFSVKEVIKALNGAKNVISICGVPRIYEALVESSSFWSCYYIKKLHVCFSGGDSLKKETILTFNSSMKVKKINCSLFEGFGLSESTSVVCVNTYKHNKIGSVGYPMSYVDIKIVDEKGNALPPNKIGEIIIKSDSNMIGYYDEKKKLESPFHDGYLYTGDLGYLDEDGFLFFACRKKRVVKVSGVATFPNEVEKFIFSIPGVSDVCVVGVEDTILGHALKAYIVTTYIDKEAFKEIVLETCSKYLIRWSVPKYIEFVDKIPKTLLQKTDYKNIH